MKLLDDPNEQLEKQSSAERLWGKYGFNGINRLAMYIEKVFPNFRLGENIKEKIRTDKYLEIQDVKEINKAVSEVISFREVQTIIDCSPPESRKHGDLFPPFKGYYITVNRRWEVALGNNWNEIKTALERSLKKKKPNFSGFKTYAILKAFVKNYSDEGVYEVETVKLVSEANDQLNQNPDVRVWYNHFNDLIGAGIVYNSRSNKYGEMTILPEVIPLVRLILNEFEHENAREIDDIKNEKQPF